MTDHKWPPDQLPVLSQGKHFSPEGGACLMEYVSVLSGEPFSDAPACTDPALAALARLVNDRILDDDVRNELALLAPYLIGVRGEGPRTTHCVTAGCLLAAASIAPLPAAAERRLARALTWSRSGDGGPRLLRACREHLIPAGIAVVSAFRAVDASVCDLPSREHDERLRDLLRDTIADCRELLDGRAGLRTLAHPGRWAD